MFDRLHSILCFTLAVLIVFLPLANAQQPTPPNAPVPIQTTQAHTVFLSNAGGDPLFSYYDGGPDRAYNDLHAAVKSWGHFQIVDTPAAADLILEVLSLANESVAVSRRIASTRRRLRSACNYLIPRPTLFSGL